MQKIVIDGLNDDTVVVNDALFSKGTEILAAQMNRILARLESLNINSFAAMITQGFLSRLNRNNQKSMTSNVMRSTGVDLAGAMQQAPEIAKFMEVKTAENAALIKSIKNEYVDNISKVIRDNVMAGERSTRLITEIKDRGGVSERKAKFIARDQTAKANSDLTQIRAEALGAKTYIWSGSLDERERTDHLAMEGKLCRWDDPTVYSDDDGATWKKRSAIGGVELQVGKDYNCRCVALPVVNWG